MPKYIELAAEETITLEELFGQRPTPPKDDNKPTEKEDKPTWQSQKTTQTQC